MGWPIATGQRLLAAGVGFWGFGPTWLSITPLEVDKLDKAATHRWGRIECDSRPANLDYDLIQSLHVRCLCLRERVRWASGCGCTVITRDLG